jgi:hypothetical protein
MIKYEKIETEIIGSVKCNKYKKEFTKEDWVEFQEFLMIDIIAGYGSVWGDSNHIQIDLCQHCAYEILKDYANET